LSESVKISFGMIVLNGEPFIRYSLQALYPFAHQIIVVEGACLSASGVSTSDGHSTDSTLKILHEFKSRDDHEDKLVIVSAADEGYLNGFWPEKDEMSQAYARRATGNYLWQVDSDEFYHEEQLTVLIRTLERERPDAVSFPMLTFWGSTDYIANSFHLIRDNAREYHRLFSWGPGYSYIKHRPPTVVDECGVDTRKKKWLRAKTLKKLGIFLYHYSLLFPQQVFNKISYYNGRLSYSLDSWEESVYRRLEKPFRVHNVYQYIGWLERYQGVHPEAICNMMFDVHKGIIVNVKIRDCTDVERLLSSVIYQLATIFLRNFAMILSYQPFRTFYRFYFAIVNRLFP